MRSEPEFQLFLKKWRHAFRVPSVLWDGNRVVSELKSARYERSSPDKNTERSLLKFVQCESGYGPRPWDMLEGIFGEVKDYKRQKRAWQKDFRDAELFLAGIQRRLTRRSLQVGDFRLKRLLANTAEAVQRRNIVLREFRAPVKFSPLGVWERLWSQNARVEDISREIDLDTRLQVQSAKMFRTFLHKDDGVSLRTIARLVVLVYLVSGLASEKRDKKDQDGRLWITDSHITSWRTVEDKLHKRRMS